ncbi:defensin [Monomorium pharaonis]|uniref:defensin n=1 Tax=Monomorium pharaonis TaxID=307658 RepID=UPI00063F04F6|nr:defensin [Monomorium pharaonis]
MKIYVFALLVVAAIAFALPIEDEVPLESLLANENESLNLAPVEESAHSRQRRVTCDLLSGLGWSHSICAAHCIAKGKKGGSCSSSGVCNCRKK